MTRLLASLVVLAAALPCASCGGDDDAGSTCGSGRSLEILAPMDGATITMADDADASMGGLQVEIAVLTCGFEEGSFTEVWVTDPFESRYAVLTIFDDTPVATTVVSLVPGNLTMEARGPEGMVVSDPISIDVTAD